MIVAYHSGHRAYDSEVRPFFSFVEIFLNFMEIWKKLQKNKSEFFFAISFFINGMKGSLIVKSHFFGRGSCVYPICAPLHTKIK